MRALPRQQVVAGSAHSVLLAASGRLYTWGDNTYGQLGDGTSTGHSAPAAVPLPAGKRFVQVAAGTSHTLALTTEGQLYAWGRNDQGQLGTGTATNSNVPVVVALPAGRLITQVIAGTSFSLALASDGTLWAWGSNASGQLGTGTTTASLTPVAVAMPTGVLFRQVAAGDAHALAVAANGTLWAWGRNDNGQLGTGTATGSNQPVAVAQGAATSTTRYVQVAAGAGHSVALADDGTAYAWGRNDLGQLGTGTTSGSLAPAAVAGLAGKALGQLVAGPAHTLALAADGTAYAWGRNDQGQLGTGTTSGSTAANPTPTALALPAGRLFAQLAAGDGHALALASDGTLWAWGGNASGQLGTGTTTASLTPALAVGEASTGYLQVAAGTNFSYGLLASGSLRAWGNNGTGQLGIGTTNSTANPTAVSVPLPAGKRFAYVAGGQDFAVALTDDGAAYAWGQNNLGQLGNGTTTSSASPVAVTMPAGKRFVQVVAGYYHALALTADGLVYGWGLNGYGQLGTASGTRTTPVLVTLSAGKHFVQLANGQNHLLALASDGTAYGLGSNSSGQLGAPTAGTTTTTAVAVTLPAGKLVASLGAGANHSLAVAADGTAYAWGSNSRGQLATGSNTDPYNNGNTAILAVPMPAGATSVAQVAGGLAYSMALTADGRIFAWGYNGNGQLGYTTPSKNDSYVPAQERTSGTRWSTIASGAGANHSLTIGPNDGTAVSDGGVFTAGLNDYGQLGDNTRTESDIFVRNKAPLPVQLVEFRAERAGATARLTWTTASELNSTYFAIERSYDGLRFAELGRVAAQGTSSAPRAYAFTDGSPAPTTVYYRLRAADLDGTYRFSPVQALSLTDAVPLLRLYPNPARTECTVAAGVAGAPVQVLDLAGRVVATTRTDDLGLARVAWPGSLPGGVYVVRCGPAATRLAVE